MKILQVRFKNLNSLVGEWQIDLTHPAFASDGIFAITGPTGAGKTTILDAICLALYGRTPRLNKVTKSGNEIMSRQTGECFAEVTFETQTGRFRCHWSQRRAHKKSDGELQNPKHEIANGDSGQIFESKIKGVADQIESATGMDFDRFTRSMLLAQGGFAAFLQAAPDERAPILEQITGTEIYSQISIRVHERQRDEREKLDLLQAETAGIVLLTPEKEKEIQRDIEIKQKEEGDLTVKSTETGKAISWLSTIDGLKKEILALADEEKTLQSDIEDFKPKREKLSLAVRAASLDGSYATLTATRNQQAEDVEALKTEEEALPGLESSAKEQAKSLELAEQQTARNKEELKAAAPVIRKVRFLDQKLDEQQKALLESEKICKKDEAKIEADKLASLEEQRKYSETQDALALVDGYFKEHTQDEWLVSNLTGVEEQLHSLITKQEEIILKEAEKDTGDKALKKAIKSLEGCQEKGVILKQALKDASDKLLQGKEALSLLLGDRLLREYRAEKETLLREMGFLRKISELEDHRATLEDGKPCPLCGATQHPYAEGNIPVFDETEQKIEVLTQLISEAEDQEAAIKKLEEDETSARKNLVEGEKQEATAATEKKAADKALAEVKKYLKKLRADLIGHRKPLSAKLLPLGITEIPDTDVSQLLESLKERLNAWQDQIKKKTEIEKLIAALESEIKSLGAVIETQSTALEEKRQALEKLNIGFRTVSEDRKGLYRDKNPDDEEFRLNKAVSDSETAERLARVLHDKSQKKWNTTKTLVESLRERIEKTEPELRKLESEFFSALLLAGFPDEEQFLEGRLPLKQIEELASKAKEFNDRQVDLKARQTDRETRLAAETAKKVTDKSLEELEPQAKEYEDALKGLRDLIAGLKNKLSENTIAKDRMKEKQTAIEAQKAECRRWENLHALIGSADGKKFRNFAQGLTFKMMIGHANRQLQKMTDRYLLVRDNDQQLELNVIDNYQAGVSRSTKNLSGGESFIVSLSLALGLSHMASQNVRVDSLFLDEGFGTLDEEALDTALETLAGLQQEGKLIGVISHVSALKERINAQIQVTPLTGGRSQISGPGCGSLSASEITGVAS